MWNTVHVFFGAEYHIRFYLTPYFFKKIEITQFLFIEVNCFKTTEGNSNFLNCCSDSPKVLGFLYQRLELKKIVSFFVCKTLQTF